MELRIKDIIISKGITLKDLATRANVSQSNLSNYLSGNISPTLETLSKIAKALNVSITELFKEKTELDFYVKYKNKMVRITESDLINLIEQKYEY